MEANFDEQSLDLNEVISKIGNYPVIEKLINAVIKVHSKNPQLTKKEVLDIIGHQQSMDNMSSEQMQDPLMETEGLYATNVERGYSFAYNTSYKLKNSFEHTLPSSKVEDHLQQLNLNSPGNNRCFTINMNDLQDDPLNVPPRQRAIKSKRKAAGRSVAHDHQYSSSTFGSSAALEDSMHQVAESAGRVPLSQGSIYPSDEVVSFPDYQKHAMSIHPQVAPEMEDVFEVSHTGYRQDYESLSLDGNSNFPNTARPVTPLFPEDSFNSNRGYMPPLVVDELKEEIPSPIPVEYCSTLDGHYESADSLQYDTHIICKSRESSRAGTPSQTFNSNSNLHSPFPQVTYFEDASTPSPCPSTPQSLNYDPLVSPAPSCSSSYTTNFSPSASTRGRSRNNSSSKRLGRPRRLSSSSSTSISREPRMSLANLTEAEKNARVRDQNNKASREYRMRKRSKLTELEMEVKVLEENQELKRRTLSDAEKKLNLMKEFLSEAQKRGIIHMINLRPPQ